MAVQNSVRSPLTRSKNVRLLSTLSALEVCESWKIAFGVELSRELQNIEFIYLYECLDTGLRFFLPLSSAGSNFLYEFLQTFDWYYMPWKWEHERAASDIAVGERVLEVGCGFGDFVQRIRDTKTSDIVGIELNEQAVGRGMSLQRPVMQMGVDVIADAEPNHFDVVCHFEVLEHVTHPLKFLSDCLRCLKVGGRLLIAVPNMDSFIRYSPNNLLNQPPHHMTQWSPATFRALPKLLPVELQSIAFEPLALYHVDWYLSTLVARVPQNRIVRGFARRCALLFGRPVLRTDLRRMVRGHTQYVVLRKL